MVVGEIIHEKDVVVIGAGPAGYEAALRAAQHGREVTLVDRSRSGGECLHTGCIPSKLLAISARKMWDSAPGVTMAPEFSMQQWHSEKAEVVERLEKGLEMRFKSNKIERVKGSASFLSSERIGVEQGEKFEVWTFQHVIIATGSRPKDSPFLSENIPGVIPVEQLYKATSIPRRLVIFGEDYLSLEAASTFRALGAEVTVVTTCDSLMGDMDETIKRELQRQFKKQKIRVMTDVSECNVMTGENLIFEGMKSTGERIEIEADTVSYSAGRISNIESLCLEQAGIEVSGNYIEIKDTCETSISRIYACGDITEGPALAIKAIKQGKTAADHCCGIPAIFSFDCMPTIIQTQIPVATVGLTEAEAIEAGYQIAAESSPMRASGYASLMEQAEGVVKVVCDKESHLLLGFHAIGAGAVELIEKATLALEMAGRDEDFSYPYSPHPGFGELWSETVDRTIEKKARSIEYNLNQ